MENVIIYGARESGQKILDELLALPKHRETKVPAVFGETQINVLAFADRNPDLQGSIINGVKVISPAEIPDSGYDKIIVGSLMGKAEIFEMLTMELSVPKENIDFTYINHFHMARRRFLLDQSKIIYDNKLDGCVAEVGVYRGEFAVYINNYFPDRTFYLFDTFEGHDKRDLEIDAKKNIIGTIVDDDPTYYLDTSIDYVKSILPNPGNAIFRAGYFPESAKDVDEQFVFVNIDLNLYAPTLASLEFFYPKMVKGGVILIHDYFSWDVEPGAHIAVDEFCARYDLSYMAIGDRMSVVIVK